MEASLPIPTAGQQGEGITLPFRYLFGEKANIAILLILFVLTLALTLVLSAVVVVMRRSFSDAVYIELCKMVAHAASVTGIIAVFLRSAGNSKQIEQTKEVVTDMAEKANGGHKRVTEVAVAAATAAERDQLIADAEFRKEIARAIVQETDLCPMLAKQITEALRNPPPPGVQT